jgi:hypothetical protein
VASHEISGSTESYEHRCIQLFRFAESHPDLAVSSRPTRSSIDTVPDILTNTGSSSHERRPLLRVRPISNPPEQTLEHLPWGFGSPSRHQSPESTHQPASQPTYGPLSVFLTPSTVYSSKDLCGFVSLHCHVLDCPLQGFPLTVSRKHSSRSLCPLVVTTAIPELSELNSPVSQCPPSGLSPTASPLSSTDGLDLPILDPFLSFHPRRFLFEHLGARLHDPSTHALTATHSL